LIFLVSCLAACRAPRPWSIAHPDPATLRHTPSGDVEGGAGLDGSQAWLGLPFAAPPVGPLRWRVPQAAKPWPGIREALDFSEACPQFATPLGGAEGRTGQVVGSEDCLYLNVWAPPFAPGEVPTGRNRLPVMLWIHGGGNSIGRSAFYDGGHLAAAEHVIVVSVQYRLGPLGWLRHRSVRSEAADDAERSGNFGTLDLIRALQWVRDDIAAFGGDPGDVTIFGESAGGQDVYSLLVSPLAKGLFQRAIVESGGLSVTTAEGAENFTDDASPGDKNSSNEMIARLLVRDGRAPDRAGAKVVLASMSDGEVATYLRGQSPRELLEAYPGNRALGMIDMPLVIRDGTVLPRGDWLTRLGTPGGWNQVPVIVGTNRDEAKLFLFLDPHRVRRVLGIFPRYVDEPSYQAAGEWLSRAWKAAGVDGPAAAMVRSGDRQVYAYRFDWRGEGRVAGADLSKMIGAAHGLEVPSVFGHFELGRLGDLLFPRRGAPGRRALSEAMMADWAAFAREGTPGNHGGAPWLPWDESGPGAPKFLVLNVPEAGGLHMSDAAESLPAIIAGIDADPRLPTERDRCLLFHEMARRLRGLTRASYPTAGAHGCADYPFDAYPW